jgi:hypothetical protein
MNLNPLAQSTSVRIAAAALAALTLASPCLAQVAMPAKPTVYNNPQQPDDPRVGLKGGVTDAGVAAQGMELLINLPKPPGFGVGTTPQEKAPAPVAAAPAAPAGGPARPPRALQLGSTNSDLAFSGNYVIMGNYNGFNIYDAKDPQHTKLVTSVLCPGSQDDVSVYKNLLFFSVESTNSRVDCGTQGIPLPAGYVPPANPGLAAAPAGGGGGGRPPRATEPPDPERFRGLRIFDISDILHPKQVAAVQTCRGTHTNTLVTDPHDKDNVYIYLAGYAPIRSPEELGGCSSGGVDDPNTALYTIVVIKVPVAHPELAKVVNSPRIFSDPSTGKMDGLRVGPALANAGTARGGTGERPVSGCHDITAYPDIGLAAGACTAVGILLDIKDPANPKRLAAISDPNFSFWHSAMFSNSGDKVIFDDEWGGGGQPRCRKDDPMTWGADSIFTRTGSDLTLDAYYKMPAPQTELENCTAHNGDIIPIPGRDIEVKSWYQGGVSIMDFTNPKHPYEIAYFDRGPLDPVKFIDGGEWSAYWYNGFIYGSEIARGLDVFKLTPTKDITQHEIDAASQIHLPEFNAQAPTKIVYPPTFITAKAYVDQLARSKALADDRAAAMIAAMDAKKTKELKADAVMLKKDAATASPEDAARMTALADIIGK